MAVFPQEQTMQQFRACSSPKMVDNHEHVEFQSRSQVPLQHISNLGHGAFGSVDCVRNVINGALYARKVFHPLAQRKRVILGFQKEMDVIRKLNKHRHVVTYVGSYVAGSELGILLLPIADQNLYDFLHGLDSEEQSAEGSSAILLNSFGCLTSGLAFMHDEGIRHKDIKPANILIHGTNVLFADFGLAFDFENLDTSATSGNPGAMTKKYSAREVHECLRRDTRADVFSLGCVFLEISTVLAKLSLDELEEALSGDTGDESWWEEGIYAFNTQAVEAHLKRIEDIEWLAKPANWCRSMMKDDSCERPRIQTCKDTIWSDLAIDGQCHQYFCRSCLHEQELAKTDLKAVEMKAEGVFQALKSRSFEEFTSPFPQDPIYELSFTWSMFEQLVNVYWRKPNKAVEASREQLLDLDSGTKIHRTDKMRGRALCLAAGIGDLDLVQRLLRAGVQTNFSDVLNSKDSNVVSSTSLRLYPPLIMAALSSNERVIEMLIHRGANVNEPYDQSGGTALHYACSKSTSNVIELLLDAGGEIERKDLNGETPLFYAVRGFSTDYLSSNLNALNLLISRNANINAQDEIGTTPLHVAAYSRDVILVLKLLEAGAHATTTDKRGRNALHFSLYGFPEIGQFYEYAIDILNQEVCLPIIELLLKHGVDIDSQTLEDGKSALLIAMQTGQNVVGNYLLSQGASRGIRDTFGKRYFDYKVNARHPATSDPNLEPSPAWSSIMSRYEDASRRNMETSSALLGQERLIHV